MRIFDFAKKELELITAQRNSLALVIAYPLLIVLVIVLTFGGTGESPGSGLERAEVTYYLPFESENFDSMDFLDTLSKVERLRLHRAKSPEDLQEAINQGIAKVGIVVEEPNSKFEKVNITVFLDNSSPLVSNIIKAYAYFSITSFANSKSTQVLTEMWENIEGIRKSLDEQRDKLEEFEQGLDSARQRITGLETKVNSIDVASIKTKLNQFDPEYITSKETISNTKTEILNTKTQLVGYKQKLITTRAELAQYSTTLKSIRSDLQTIRSSSPEPIYSQLGTVENELNSTISKIDSSIADIDSAIQDIESSQQKLDQAHYDLGLAETRLDSAKQTVDEFKVAVDDLDDTLTELKVLIQDSDTFYNQTKENLTETKALLDSLTDTLNEFMQYKPAQLITPFTIKEEKMYLKSEDYMGIERTAILIPISVTIVLLLTCVLFASISTILERTQGINIRVYSSTTGKLPWISGKIIGQILFALIEAGIILAMAFFVFSVPLVGSPIDLVIAIIAIAFVFISLGIFLTNFTNEQSTAILASLLIMIPFLFMSGFIFPIEFMPFYMQGIANMLPLTVGSSLLMNIIIKGIPLINSLDKLFLLVIPGLVLVAITIFNKKI